MVTGALRFQVEYLGILEHLGTPEVWCAGLALASSNTRKTSFGTHHQREGEVLLRGQELVSMYFSPGLCVLERSLSVASLRWHNTGGEHQSTNYKPCFNWHRTRCLGLLSMVGEIIASHWTVTTSLKLDSPQPIWCCPATASLLHSPWAKFDFMYPPQDSMSLVSFCSEPFPGSEKPMLTDFHRDQPEL